MAQCFVWSRRLTGFAWLTSAILSWRSPPPTYTGPGEKLIIAAYAGAVGTLVYIAQDQGYFAENGLEVTIKPYEAGKLAADALLAGEADVATAADSVLVSQSFGHDDLRVLGTVALANTCELVARKDRDINHPADLPGKKVGVTRQSAGEFYLGAFLIDHGLAMQEIDIVDLKPSGLAEALATGDKAPPAIKRAFLKQVGFLLEDIRHPSLRAKRYDAERWQARVTRDWRFYFRIEGDIYILLDIMAHPK